MNAVMICRWLLPQAVLFAPLRAKLIAGTSRPARIAMNAITTRSSIKVKPCLVRRLRRILESSSPHGDSGFMDAARMEWMGGTGRPYQGRRCAAITAGAGLRHPAGAGETGGN